MSDDTKFVIALLWPFSVLFAVLITGVLSDTAGKTIGKRVARELICTEAGYDGHRQIDSSTYCFTGSGDDVKFVLVGPMEGDQ